MKVLVVNDSRDEGVMAKLINTGKADDAQSVYQAVAHALDWENDYDSSKETNGWVSYVQNHMDDIGGYTIIRINDTGAFIHGQDVLYPVVEE